MSVEYFEGIGFGLSEESEPHIHSWLTRPWRVRDFPGAEIYDCACGVRRMVPIGMHPNDGQDMPAQPFPESCPQWSTNSNYETPPPLLLTCPPETNQS